MEYYWQPILAHFLLIGFFCFAWLFVLELVIHNLMRWAAPRLPLSAAGRALAILFLDGAAFMLLSMQLRDAFIAAAIMVYFLPVAVLEALVLAVLWILRRYGKLRAA